MFLLVISVLDLLFCSFSFEIIFLISYFIREPNHTMTTFDHSERTHAISWIFSWEYSKRLFILMFYLHNQKLKLLHVRLEIDKDYKIYTHKKLLIGTPKKTDPFNFICYFQLGWMSLAPKPNLTLGFGARVNRRSIANKTPKNYYYYYYYFFWYLRYYHYDPFTLTVLIHRRHETLVQSTRPTLVAMGLINGTMAL